MDEPVARTDIVILCGGLGKRLHPVAEQWPKSMATINQQPFLDLLLNYLSQQGFQRFVLCTGHKKEFIKKYYQRKKNRLQIEFSEEEEPLGTGGAIKKARPLIHSDPFLVLNGDSFCRFDALKFLEFHKRKGAIVSMVVTKIKESDDYGTIRLDSSSEIVSFSEKTKVQGTGFVNAGIYLFQQEVFSLMPDIGIFSLEQDFFPEIVGHSFYGYITDGPLIDIGTPERYQKAKESLRDGIKGILEDYDEVL